MAISLDNNAYTNSVNFNYVCDSGSVCSGHGTCNNTGICQCSQGWGGSNCNTGKFFVFLVGGISVVVEKWRKFFKNSENSEKLVSQRKNF